MHTNKNNPINYDELSILVTEDDELSFLYINIILKTISKHIVRAKTGQEAIELIEKNNFDILLLDVNLPDISGVEVANNIHKTHPELGIILNSAFSLEEDRKDAMKKANFEYLTKPLKKNKILAAIEKVLQPEANN